MKWSDVSGWGKWLLLGVLITYTIYLWSQGVGICFRRILLFFCGLIFLLFQDPRGMFNIVVILLVTLMLWSISSQNQLDLRENPQCYNFDSNIFLFISYIAFNFLLAVFTIMSTGFIILFSITMCYDFWGTMRGRRNANFPNREYLTDLETKFLQENFKIPFHSGSMDTNSCSICLVHFEESEMIVMLPECKHIYHEKCLDQWLNINSVCPYCRFNVRDMIRQRMDHSIIQL